MRQNSTNKRLVVHVPVRANLYSLQQFVHLLVCHLLTELREHVSQLACPDESVSFLVEHLETPDELLRCARWFEPVWAIKDRQECFVVDCEMFRK